MKIGLTEIVSILGTLFLGLEKTLNGAAYSWWMVFSPLWGPPCFGIVVFFMVSFWKAFKR